MNHIMTGFGFGPIQAGLFAVEAQAGGRFSEIAVAEVDAELVDALRAKQGQYAVNVAGATGRRVVRVNGVRLLNPREQRDRMALEDCLARSTEIVTSLPSVDIYTAGGESSPAALIARALESTKAPATIIYTAENNNHAAEILEAAVEKTPGGTTPGRPRQFLNTVIGKMSQVVTDPDEITRRDLTPIVPGLDRAFLVEEFNRILVSETAIEGFTPGISAFIEKEDLLPFEEAKLYGHNAIHALLGFMAADRGCSSMAELAAMPDVMATARDAFINEVGTALIRRHQKLEDPLFTPAGFEAYAEDLLARITNPHLDDAVSRAVRDPLRKLGYADRIFGAIRLCLEHDIAPRNLAAGARAGLALLLANPGLYNLPAELRNLNPARLSKDETSRLLAWLWHSENPTSDTPRITDLLATAA